MLTIQDTNEYCLTIEAGIQQLRDELDGIPKLLAAAMTDADAAGIAALKERQRELNAAILNAAAAGQRQLRDYQSKLSLDQQAQFSKAEEAKKKAEAALSKLRSDFVEAEQKALEDLQAADRCLTELWSNARWSNDRLFEFDQALRQTIAATAECV